MNTWVYVRFACALVALSIVCGCGAKEEPVPEPVRPVVTIVTPEPGAGRARSFPGAAQAASETPLSFRVGGELAELKAVRGQVVRKGDLVARLDDRDFALQLEQSKAELARAAAQLEQARSEIERARQLYEANNVSKGELDAAEAAFKSAQAFHEAAAKGAELAAQQLGYCVLTSPVDGRVTQVPVEPFQTVAAGQTIAGIASGDRLEMQLGLPEALIGAVRPGLEALVRFDTLPGEAWTARVTEVAVQPDMASTYPVTLALDDADTRVRPGMVGAATLVLATAGEPPATLVPAASVVPTPEGGHYVWVFDPAREVVLRRAVRIGALTPEGVEVFEGVAPGERVVTRGVHRLAEGQRVRLMDE